MVTLDSTPELKHGGTYAMAFKGLSTDTKPVERYEKLKIANGSSFMEIDTKSLKFYDEEGEQWV